MPNIKANLVGAKMPAAFASAIAGYNSSGLTATGSTSQANSYAIGAEITQFATTAANTGARLPSNASTGDSFLVVNFGASTLLLYPPSGGKLNNGSADASVNVATTKSALCFCLDNLNFVVFLVA